MAASHRVEFANNGGEIHFILDESFAAKLQSADSDAKERFVQVLRSDGGNTKQFLVPFTLEPGGVVVTQEQQEEVAAATCTTAIEVSGQDSRVNWNDTMTQLLLETRLTMEEDFNKPISKQKLWKKIAKTMQDNGYDITWMQCTEKYKNLLVTYKRNCDKACRSGEDAPTWKYYKLMNDVLGHKNLEKTMLKEKNASTVFRKQTKTPFRTSSPAQLEETDDASCFDFASIPKPSSRKRSAHTIQDDRPPKWFEDFLVKQATEQKERQEKDDARWQEFLASEKQKVEAMHALTEVLKLYMKQ